MKKVAIVGTQGIPAHYGGFETLVENLVKHNNDNEYIVFCSSRDLSTRLDTYMGAKLKYIPLHSNGMESILYDFISMLRTIIGYDTVLILGVSGCIFIPFVKLFCKAKFIVNIDGLEHRREKWNSLARWFLLKSESVAVRFADTIISDNKGIRDYVTETYNRRAELIAYGGDQVLVDVSEEKQQEVLVQYGLAKNEYAITVCRIEPENNVDMILNAFAECADKIVVVGNFKTNDYAINLTKQFGQYNNIILLDSVYDINMLYILRHNAKYYVHGHSAGGTNPSLVEAMFFGRPIFAYDVVYNRETTQSKANYYSNKDELIALIKSVDLQNNKSLKDLANELYRWNHIAQMYERLY